MSKEEYTVGKIFGRLWTAAAMNNTSGCHASSAKNQIGSTLSVASMVGALSVVAGSSDDQFPDVSSILAMVDKAEVQKSYDG